MTTLNPLRFKILGYREGGWSIVFTRKTGKLEPGDYEYQLNDTFRSREQARQFYRANILGRTITAVDDYRVKEEVRQ